MRTLRLLLVSVFMISTMHAAVTNSTLAGIYYEDGNDRMLQDFYGQGLAVYAFCKS